MWERWLFAEHPRAELSAWAQRLEIFRFVRAAGDTDGDLLLAALQLADARSAMVVVSELRLHEIGDPVAFDVDGGRLVLSLRGEEGRLGSSEVAIAAGIEQRCSDIARAAVVDPPLDDRRCVCPKWHPALFALGDRGPSPRH